MTEAQWLTTDDPVAIFEAVANQATDGQLRHFCVAVRGPNPNPDMNWCHGRLLRILAATIAHNIQLGGQPPPKNPMSTEQRRVRVASLRDIFGNPFRPATIDSSLLTWSDGTIPRIAQRVYEERAFGDLPILGDALENAGCTDHQMLEHCRRPGLVHVRGCWVLNLLTRRS